MEVWTGGGKQWRRAVAQRAVFRCRERGMVEGNERSGTWVSCVLNEEERQSKRFQSLRCTCTSTNATCVLVTKEKNRKKKRRQRTYATRCERPLITLMQKGPWSVVPFVCLLLDSPQRCQAPEAVWTLPYYGAQVLISSKGMEYRKKEQAERV